MSGGLRLLTSQCFCVRIGTEYASKPFYPPNKTSSRTFSNIRSTFTAGLPFETAFYASNIHQRLLIISFYLPRPAVYVVIQITKVPTTTTAVFFLLAASDGTSSLAAAGLHCMSD